MGDPKFARAKIRTPSHPWKQARIDEEHALKEKYGLKKVGGMREIWREKSALRRHRNQAMKLIGKVDTSEGHFAREKTDMIESLLRKGLLPEGAGIDDVLQITAEHMLSRRLQSVVYYRGLAPTMRSSRNLIVHGHISIGDQKMTVPGYHVLKQEEDVIQYSTNSPFADSEHQFRKDMEELRLTLVSDEDEDGVEPVRVVDPEFVEQVKRDAAASPSTEDTVSTENKPTEESES
ncbi:MAG TPA: 30S ribosomal protein S4 [Candidatus Poseidoniales archaeon]|jgi:small subunit ribosomal protein S4|nr:MAG: 30S ribosomal protein S4 [Euryarchaeota archaeon]HIG37963.1 30S ribosomal protein S4 [Candidatus Poseidoniales archaeon]HIL44111.1 30S ribosomal protein S4 [Candidatus Poseidoniales archaeon]